MVSGNLDMESGQLQPGDIPIARLKKQILCFSFLNFFVLASAGLMLRSGHFINLPFEYRNLLHAHSHFAFGGWVLPLMTWLVIQYFPKLTAKISFHHLKNVVRLEFLSAYGMLCTFPFMGYALMSILFSTVSVISGFYLAVIFWKASHNKENLVSIKLLKAAFVFLILSSLGPFGTGPLIALGKAGSNIYFDLVYFYLHFQYNGFFSFVIFAVLVKQLENKLSKANGKMIFILLVSGCIATFPLSVLWHDPPEAYNMIGAFGAFLQITGIWLLIRNYSRLINLNSFAHRLIFLSLTALGFKLLLQALSAFSFIAKLAYANRNFIIAYLHLVLIGFISLFVIGSILQKIHYTKKLKVAVSIFLVLFSITELILILNACGFVTGELYHTSIFGFTALLAASALMMMLFIVPELKKNVPSPERQPVNRKALVPLKEPTGMQQLL